MFLQRANESLGPGREKVKDGPGCELMCEDTI